jgi:SAM-dependent methyltransferase
MTSYKHNTKRSSGKNYRYTKQREPDYIKEVNAELDMDVYYMSKSMPNFITHGTYMTHNNVKNNVIKLNYLKEFILKVVDNHLWKYPTALNEFQMYIVGIFNNTLEDSWINNIAFYETIHKQYHILNQTYNIQSKLGENTHGGIDRGDNRIKSIEKYVLQRQPNSQPRISPSCYLDVGCFDGSITNSIARYFKLNKLQTHGVDIKSYGKSGGESEYDDITFTEYDGKFLPYSDDSFDLITCLMVLHHIPEENLNTLMSEINRVMKPNGVIILREHDVNKDIERNALDIMHHFYDYVWSGDHWADESNDDTTIQWQTNYKSNIEWTEIFISHGFVSNTPASVFHNDKINPFMSYMCSYRKLPIKATIDTNGNVKLYRVLPDDLPREVYRRRTNEIKSVLHWGQRKLLLSEIEFFTMFILDNPSANNIYAVYAGSAPGTHILYLAKLFPTIHFELYDPREFSNKLLKNKEMINIHVQYFTDDTAREWVSSDHLDKTILFISDIRTGEPETQTPERVEEMVKIDHKWQQTWYHIIKPALSMFKFRLPWDDEKTEYLDGDIYIQSYPPATSTESRLIIGKNAGTKIYDNRKYEEQLFYFNNHIRSMDFTNKMHHIHPTRKNGLSNNYDSASEVYILDKYLRLYDIKSTDHDNVIKNKIATMVGEISHELSYSRTLYSQQPIKEHTRKVLVNLQKLGYVPNNIDLTRSVFNTYVIPRYDYFKSKGLLECST